MTITFPQREGGFYPVGNFVDYSYSQNRNEIMAEKIVVNLKPFAMDKTPVTNAQFAKLLTASVYKPAHTENLLPHWINNAPPAGQADHPVVWITLDDTRAYARWAGKRLPTEAEWQWAAQNGLAGNAYPWGNTYDSTRVNTGQWGGTTPVMKFDKGRTPTGLYDMSGNVW